MKNLNYWKEGKYKVDVCVNEKGFFSFAAEKAGTKEWNLDAAKVMKPRVELNLREE